MHTYNKNVVSAALAALLIPLSAHAAEPSHPCAALYDDAQRLGCYDGAFGRPVQSGTKSSAPAAKASQPAAPEQPSTYKSPITGLSRTADGRFIATLENGEAWVQLERDSAVEVKVGETATLQRMLFGNYTLATKSGYTVRVKRAN